MTKGDDIQERLNNFAINIIRLSALLPKNRAGNHIISASIKTVKGKVQ